MKSYFRIAMAVSCVLALVGGAATAQDDLSAQLNKVGAQNVQNYIAPIFNGFAADLNSGFYHSADLHDVLGFDLGVKVGLALITDAEKTYDFVTPDNIKIKNPLGGTFTLTSGIDYDKVISGVPTVVGAADQNSVHMKSTSAYYAAYRAANNSSDVLFPIPPGFNLPAVPLPMPQLNLGLPFGLEFMLRYVPTIPAGDYGKVNLSGFGLRYDIGQWIPLCPVDIAVHIMTQKMAFKSKDDKDIFSGKGTAYGLEVSKKLLILTLYGGFQLENASFTLAKTDGAFKTPDGTETTFTIPEMTFDGQNKSRFTLGVRLQLFIINIHAEYSFAKTPVAALGAGISIR